MAEIVITFDQSSRLAVNEGQSLAVTVRFFNDSWVATAPTTLRYRIDCLTTGVMVLDWVIVTAATSVSIAVTATDNKIQNDRNVRERKQLLVQTNYGTATQGVETVEWDVLNLLGVT